MSSKLVHQLSAGGLVQTVRLKCAEVISMWSKAFEN